LGGGGWATGNVKNCVTGGLSRKRASGEGMCRDLENGRGVGKVGKVMWVGKSRVGSGDMRVGHGIWVEFLMGLRWWWWVGLVRGSRWRRV